MVVLIGLVATVCPRAAAEAWEVKLGLGPVFGTEFDPDRAQGLGGQAYLEVGLDDFVSLSLGGGYNQHFLGGPLNYSLANAGVGIHVNLDVILFGVGLAWVPFAEARLGYLRLAQSGQAVEHGLGLAIGVGLDYIWSESASAGFALEYHGQLSNIQGLPGYLAVTARLGLRWLD